MEKYRAWEYNIIFGRRYMMDKGLIPLNMLYYARRGHRLVEIFGQKEANPKFKLMSFDIETYNPLGAPRKEQDPIIMISYSIHQNGGQVLTYKKISRDFVQAFDGEKEMIEAFGKIIEQSDPDVLAGYNSTQFDLPYLQARAIKNKCTLKLGRDGSSFRVRRRGMQQVAYIKGRIYVDLLPLLRFLSFIGAVKVSRYDLKTTYSEIMGKKSDVKAGFERLDIYKMWDDPSQLGPLADYSQEDANITWELAHSLLPLELEMSRVTRLPPSDVVGATSSQLVESLIMHEAAAKNAIVPNKPTEEEAKKREMNPIKGAFVRTPPPGIYENLVVFDFRGLYPSIIISHNIDPFTLNCQCCKDDGHRSPTGVHFCKRKKGLIPQVLQKVVSARAELKDRLKSLEVGSEEYRAVFARQQSLKILANSYYGYLAFSRSRYYSREAAESVTAWGRHYIMQTGEKAQEAGFTLLYQDTDSCFLLLGNKAREDVLKWMEEVNSSLPKGMELELEAFYPRGVFVSKKTASASGEEGSKLVGAKKKYALIDDKGRIKIRGFEMVRRDWSAVARDTQRQVLEAILKDGSKEKAVEIVRKVIEEVRAGKMPLEKMAIETQLVKDIKDYEAKSPELAAALKYNQKTKNEKLGMGSVVRFVITNSSGMDMRLYDQCKKLKASKSSAKASSISEKAEVLEYAKDYDADYYINHQIIPAVLKILKELGVEEEDLKRGGKQQGLGAFF
jgi:DNA polymerase I